MAHIGRAGVYRAPKPPGSEPTASITRVRTSWSSDWDTVPASEREDHEHYSAVERTLANATRPGSWLVLSVAPEHTLDAAARVAQRFHLREYDLDRAMLRAMRDIAASNGIDWDLVLGADSDGHADRPHLEELVREAFARVEDEIRGRTEPLLLTFPGLLGRFRLTERLNLLRESGGPALWLLAPGRRQAQPAIDEVLVPTLSEAQRAWLSPYWLARRTIPSRG